jgi:hypothetical protein
MVDWERIKATAFFSIVFLAGMVTCGILDNDPDDWMDDAYDDAVAYFAKEKRDPHNPPMKKVFTAASYEHIPVITSLHDYPLNVMIRHAEQKREDVDNDRCYDLACGRKYVPHIRTFADFYAWEKVRIQEIKDENENKFYNNKKTLKRNGDFTNIDTDFLNKTYPKSAGKLSKYKRAIRAYNTRVKTWNKEHPNNQKQKLYAYMPYSTAFSAYQFTGQTMRTVQVRHNLPDDYELTNDVIDWLQYQHLIHKRGLDKFLNGDIRAEEFAYELAKEYAGIPLKEGVKNYKGRPAKAGESYYAGYNGNSGSSDVDYNDVIKTLKLIKKIHDAGHFQPRYSSLKTNQYLSAPQTHYGLL